MKKLLIFLLLAVTSLGFMVSSPEAIRKQEKEARAFQKKIKKDYDLLALRDFLLAQIGSKKIVDGIDLSNSKTTDKWILDGPFLSCGDWSFYLSDGSEKSNFELSWRYESKPGKEGGVIDKTITLKCRRMAKATFLLVSASREEGEEYIILSP